MDALVVDFDGVVVDSEPTHCLGVQRVLNARGYSFTSRDYYEKYLGYDDHDCFLVALRDRGIEVSEEQIAEMTAEKTAIVQKAMSDSIEALPGAVELIRAVAGAGIPVAVCSGALREEIELASRRVGVWDCFVAVVAAKDVRHGKPDPEGYRLARRQLERKLARRIDAARCVAIEDSPAGIEAARGAGMKVLAVTNSYAADALKGADRVVESLTNLTASSLAALVTP